MFKTRLLSGILLVIIAFVTICLGGDVLFVTLLAISLIGMMELCQVVKVGKKLPGIVSYLAAAVYYFLLRADRKEDILFLVILFLVVLMAVYVFSFPAYGTEQIVMSFFALFYVAVMLSYIYQTRLLEDGLFLVGLVFLCSWGCDTCAYCVGMLIGKHKMAPVLSPKKSVEGAVGGVVGAVLLGAVYGAAVKGEILEYGVICGAGALISMVGDLAASAIKRNHDIKDYGTLIPGHGGIMDRFDSVIFTAPVIYYLARLLLG